MAHGAVVEVRQTARRDDERVLGSFKGLSVGLLEHATRRVVFACFLLVGVHVRETGARQAQHALAVRFNLAGRALAKPRGRPSETASLYWVVHHVLVDGRLSVVVVDSPPHLVPRETAHLLRPVLTRGIGALEERNLIRVPDRSSSPLPDALRPDCATWYGRDERVHGPPKCVTLQRA